MSALAGDNDETRTSSRGRVNVERYCPTCNRSYQVELARCPEDGTRLVELADDDELAAGREIDGRFTIIEPFSSGGMGTVYRAQQISVGREVAIKVIHPRLGGDRTAAKRFLREAMLTSQLSHSNTVTVLDFGQTEDRLLYLVMELLPGRPLSEVLAEHAPLPTRRAIRIAMQICDALEAAHELDIVHRDLKPSNIIAVDEREFRDVIKVLDFGLSKSLSAEETAVTRSDVLVGTPRYMSPDVVLGHPVDARTDLYSLGVILYEMVSGRLPFRGDEVEVLINQHAMDEPIPLDDAIPAPLRRIIDRLLEKHPDDRYKRAVDVHAALASIGEESPAEVAVPSAAITRPEPAGLSLPSLPSLVRPPIRRWLPLLGLALVAAVAVVFLSMRGHDGASARVVDGGVAATVEVAADGLADPGAAGADGATTAADAGPVDSAPPQLVELRLESTPTGATVLIDGVALGTTPHSERRLLGSDPLTVVFARKRYRRVKREVIPDRSHTIHVKLPRKSRTRPGIRPKSQPDAAPTPPPKPKPPWIQ